MVARTLAILVFAAALGTGCANAQQPAAQPSDQATSDQAPAKIPSTVCLGCHGVEGFAVQGADGKMRSLYIEPSKFLNSVHGKTWACVDCHQQVTKVPHEKLDRIKVGCITCHQDLYENALFENKPAETAELGMVVQRIDAFMKTIHARPNRQDQSTTNATCYNCHDAHYIYPKGTPIWSEWHLALPKRCGSCHTQEFAEYSTSIHGRQVLLDYNPKAATCAECHTSHNIESTALPATLLTITQNCGNCHQAQLKSYLETYHGQVTKLGYTFTAKCFNCHGYHNIQRVNDPGSKVSPANRLQTCRQCHQYATAGFVTFEPHATTNDFARYPYTWLASKFMILLLGGTFTFFWTHSAFWYFREVRDHLSGAHRLHVQTGKLLEGIYYQRWSAMWRLAHLCFALTVIFLVFTGMTLFYADSFWAPAVQHAFGGPRITGTAHRIIAVAFLSIFFAHLAYVLTRIARNWRTFRWFGPTSMIPNLQDIIDIFLMFRWFVGLGQKPLFDKWSYWEKFDYWAPFWGVTIIGVSGAMLWFNTITASILPGWVFNVAMIFHGEEAFLAAGFLFTVHFFNNHWRPENFPLDILMFTGVMPLEKFRREHTKEYDRLLQTGQLQKYLVEAPSQPMKLGSQILGFTLMAAGLILLILILSGFVRSMTS